MCLHMELGAHGAAEVGRWQLVEWHRSCKGPPGQYGVNRPNKVADYVSLEEPWKPKDPQIPTTVSRPDQWTHKQRWGGGGVGWGGLWQALALCKESWWFLLWTTKKEEAEWLHRSNPVKGNHCGESKRPLTTSKEQTEGSRLRAGASAEEMPKLTRVKV